MIYLSHASQTLSGYQSQADARDIPSQAECAGPRHRAKLYLGLAGDSNTSQAYSWGFGYQSQAGAKEIPSQAEYADLRHRAKL